MRVQEWLWPDLDTVDIAADDIARVAKAIYVVLAIEAVLIAGLEPSYLFDSLLAFLLSLSMARRRSRIAAYTLLFILLLGWMFIGLDRAGIASFIDYPEWIMVIDYPEGIMVLVPSSLILTFLSFRGCRATRVYHGFVISRIIWKAVMKLLGLIIAYFVCAMIVAGGLFALYRGDVAIEAVSYSSITYLLTLPFLISWRLLPGTKGLAVVDYPIGREPDAMFADNDIARHWRGDLSLRRSFWAHVVGLNVALLATILAFGWVAGAFQQMAEARIVGVGVSVLIFVTIWQTVGCWRSAARQRTSGRGVISARAIQIVLALIYLPAWGWFPAVVIVVAYRVLLMAGSD